MDVVGGRTFAICLLLLPVAVGAPTPDDPWILRQGVTIAGFEVHEYVLEVRAGEWVAVELLAAGADLGLRLANSTGLVVAESQRPSPGLDAVIALVSDGGHWAFEVRNPAADPGSYDVRWSVVDPLAWLGSGGATIAVLDTGVDVTHPEFEMGQVVAWRDFTTRAAAGPWDDHGHGTAVTSLAVGRSVGAFPGSPVAVGKVLSRTGNGEWDDVAQGVRWSHEEVGARVVLLSLGANVPMPGIVRPEVLDAIEEATRDGVMVVVANGNTRLVSGSLYLPRSAGGVLAVGATFEDGTVWPDSRDDPELVAHGALVCVARAAGRPTPAPGFSCGNGIAAVGLWDGSSFSAARVAGWADALRSTIESEGGSVTAVQIERALKVTARDTAHVPYAREGHGFVDEETVSAALKLLRQGGASEDEVSIDQVQNAGADSIAKAYSGCALRKALASMGAQYISRGAQPLALQQCL